MSFGHLRPLFGAGQFLGAGLLLFALFIHFAALVNEVANAIHSGHVGAVEVFEHGTRGLYPGHVIVDRPHLNGDADILEKLIQLLPRHRAGDRIFQQSPLSEVVRCTSVRSPGAQDAV